MEEAEVKPESKQQESKPKTDGVPETFAELVEDWKKTDGPGIRKKSQTTFEHYTEALSAYFSKLNKKKLATFSVRMSSIFLTSRRNATPRVRCERCELS